MKATQPIFVIIGGSVAFAMLPLGAMHNPELSRHVKAQTQSLYKLVTELKPLFAWHPPLVQAATPFVRQLAEETKAITQVLGATAEKQAAESLAAEHLAKIDACKHIGQQVRTACAQENTAYAREKRLAEIVAQLSTPCPLDGKRTDLSLKEKIDIDTQRYATHNVGKSSVVIYQYPCLNQHKTVAGMVMEETTNYCGYYALYHASCFALIPEKTPLLKALVDRPSFVEQLRRMLPTIAQRRRTTMQGYDKLDSDEIQLLINALGLQENVCVVEQQYIEGFLKNVQMPLPQALLNFKSGIQEHITLVYAYGGTEGHWLTIDLRQKLPQKANQKTVDCVIADSLGVLDWLSGEGKQFIQPLYDFLLQ